MTIMSVRIDERKRKALKIMASVEGKTMSGLMEELIDNYIQKNREKFSQLLSEDHPDAFMKLPETTFSEWDNDEDEIYNNL